MIYPIRITKVGTTIIFADISGNISNTNANRLRNKTTELNP